MTQHLSQRITSMSTSATLAMAAKAKELRTQGKDIISLSLGEPDFNILDPIKDAAKQAIDDNYSSYSPVDGYEELKRAIIDKFKNDNYLNYKSNQIVVSTGAKQSLANVAMVMLDRGDEVILPAPYWVSYNDIVKLAEGVPIVVPTSIESDFKITPSQLEAAITPRTKMLWFSSPCNPSGSVYSEDELYALVQILKKYPNIFIVSDEIYEHINFRGNHVSIAAFDEMFDRTITVNGVSKAFAMTGWRIGFIGAPEWVAKACTKFQGQITSGANSIAQRATISALQTPISQIQFMIDEFRKRRDIIVALLREIDGFKLNVPEGAFYVFPDISDFFGRNLKGTIINNASDFALFLLENANVATVSGDAFGSPNCIRISYSVSEKTIREAIFRIKEVL